MEERKKIVRHGRPHLGREPFGPEEAERDRPPAAEGPAVASGPGAFHGTEEEVLGHAHGTPGRPELAVGPQPRYDIMLGPQTEEKPRDDGHSHSLRDLEEAVLKAVRQLGESSVFDVQKLTLLPKHRVRDALARLVELGYVAKVRKSGEPTKRKKLVFRAAALPAPHAT